MHKTKKNEEFRLCKNVVSPYKNNANHDKNIQSNIIQNNDFMKIESLYIKFIQHNKYHCTKSTYQIFKIQFQNRKQTKP